MDEEQVTPQLFEANIIRPGDKVLITFERLTADQTRNIAQMFQQRLCGIDFVILAGAQSVTIQRSGIEYDPPVHGVVRETGPRPMSQKEYDEWVAEYKKYRQEDNSPVVSRVRAEGD